MLKTNIGFVEFCNQALNGNTGYVYGTLGQVCTNDLLDQCAKRFPSNNLAGGAMRTLGNKWIGHRVMDCIDLLKYYATRTVTILFWKSVLQDSAFLTSAMAAKLLANAVS